MTAACDEILGVLDALGIRARVLEHEPVRTMADSLRVPGYRREEAVFPKNIFLSNRQGTAHYLHLMQPDAEFRTSQVSRALGVSRLSFAPPERVAELLNTHPGAVSPLGLWFDRETRVRLVMQRALSDARAFAFHPCDDERTVVMTASDFFDVFLPAARHAPCFI